MTIGRFYGDHPTITGDRQVPQLPATKVERPPILLDRFFRNGKAPDASAMNEMCQQMNQAMLFRTKTLGEITGLLGQSAGLAVSSAGAGSRARWRFAFHTGPYHRAALCSAEMYPQTAGAATDAYATLKIYSDVTETTLVTTVEFHYGAAPTDASRTAGWQLMKAIDKEIETLSPNTDYYAVVSDVDNGLIQSISVGEIPSLTENYNGYLPQNYSAESNVLDEDLANLVAPMPTLWKRGGAKVLNWSVDVQSSPQSSASVTPTNLIDNSSTTYSSSIPGFTLSMTGKARLSQSTGAPCVMKVFGRNNGATAKGRLYLKDSGGTTVAVITDGWGIGTPAWQSVAFNMPATSAKYYLVFDDNGSASFQVYAVSIYEYE